MAMTAESTDEGLLRMDRLPMADDRGEGYAILRAAGPVVHADTGYLVTTRELAEHVFKNPGTFSSQQAFDTLGSPVPLVPIAFDPPAHTRYRRLLQPFFTPRAAATLEQAVRDDAVALIDTVAERGSCDVVTELARPIPAAAFLALFGIPAHDLDRLLSWREVIVQLADLSGSGEATPEAVRSAAELYAYVAAHVAECRAGRADGLLRDLFENDSADEPFTDEEAIGLCFIFVLAGVDTVTSALSLMFARLATHPELRRRLAEDPSAIPAAIEEMLRIDPPNAVIPRVAAKDVVLEGVRIPAGTSVGVAMGAVNRDPRELNDPDAFDPGREYNNLTWGSGPHRCIGVHLARVQLRIVLEEWHRRIPEYELAPGARPQVIWPTGVVGINSVPVVFPAAP
ncbi:cytochrome P450 [Actinoallomurus iriomotensis]|uniref:Cytochrome P450 143 n=1 Tax=Actinoallomurus iriomotensis TaxID=478107 RepID=A0A9W6RSQ2_9ACTN|nr:cytochrome P450 [Actinoallomurus iriomotensis]GLY80970.1 putative cytochrome P450 143 [Actinoallomurus iriomotensis]